MITDFHAHAFPDALAEHAIRTLESETDKVKAWLDGRVSSLLASMDRAGIRRSVICSIATKPDQFEGIRNWSKAISSARIVAFPSVHPRDPLALDRLDRIAQDGFKGVKFHPYYQDFDLADERIMPLFARIESLGLIVVSHTGFDIAFPRVRRADPVRVMHLLRRFPKLKFVATHLGGWDDWDEVRRHMLGSRVHMEISYALEEMSAEAARAMILAHPEDRVLFGTDSPWQDQSAALALLRNLRLGRRREASILEHNAERLLGS